MDTSPVDGPSVGGAQNTFFQFSLRSLLFSTALMSVPLTLLHWLGVNYLFSVALSIGLLTICLAVYDPKAPKTLLLSSGLAFPASIGITFFYVMATFSLGGTGPFILHTLINFAVCAACVLTRCSRKSLSIAICLTAIVPYAMKISDIQKVRQTFEQMLVNYPLESLEERLVFETREIAPQISQQEQVSRPPLSISVMKNLSEQEQRYGSGREWALRELHENYRTQFAAAAGFGFIRMRRLSPNALQPEPFDLANLPLPISTEIFAVGTTEDSNALHQLVTYDVLNRDKIGYVQDMQHVAGFQSHSPTYLTNSINQSGCCDEEDAPPRWQLTRLELVSLLRHSTPRVYVSDTLPEMDALDNFEHRPLSAFESSALPQLQIEKDVVAEINERRILMFGALRASKGCLQCHQGKRGKLLGALSYKLARLDTLPQGH